MIIKNFISFEGQHCETTATGTLLKNIGIDLSEPMLFGLGEGLGFICWHMKSFDLPFIGGRIKPDVVTQNIARNLHLKLEVAETSSVKKAWETVKKKIDSGTVVALKLDCYHLEYFTKKVHFAGHYVAMYGYDEQYAYLVDTQQQGGIVKTSLENLALARNEKGPMSSKNLSYTVQSTGKEFDLAEAVVKAVKNNATDYLNPPISNIGYKGIIKTSKEIKKWFKNSKNVERDFKTIAVLMEKAGTGGALFRNLYRDFLGESYDLLKKDEIKQAHTMFCDIAKSWNQVSELLYQAGETKDSKYIDKASEVLIELSNKERAAMEILANI